MEVGGKLAGISSLLLLHGFCGSNAWWICLYMLNCPDAPFATLHGTMGAKDRVATALWLEGSKLIAPPRVVMLELGRGRRKMLACSFSYSNHKSTLFRVKSQQSMSHRSLPLLPVSTSRLVWAQARRSKELSSPAICESL